ncbi:methionyl-tRNA formyltransferase [Schlesneria paludicola]|uniref:methionyl-tRNA formyltransferase n=1 Tax=Schlesneria paludicola TaxID=360056 RepID=UPI00029A084C|nr:methionyl-tRNA formyltransferase [Schlesneria paludicola]
MALRLLFLGTGPLALPAFQALCDSHEHEVVGLVTQPDRTGRGHHQHLNPLKELANARGLSVLQPVSIKTPESVQALQQTQADLFVVAAYGQILSNAVLAVPRLGTINIHASLLPKYRGATPIHAAVLNGDQDAGVTIIEIVQKLDAGPMLGKAIIPVKSNETTGELEQRLAELAIPLTQRVINEIETGTVERVSQDESLATHVRKLSKSDGLIPWTKSAIEVERHVRGMQPWPGPFSHLHQPGKPPLRLQILAVLPQGDAETYSTNSPPGTVIAVTPETLTIRCGENAVQLLTLQPDGKRPMPAADFLRGRKVSVGDTLG